MGTFFSSYKNKLIIAFIIIAIIPIIIIGVSVSLKIQKQVANEAIQAKIDVMVHEVEKIEMWLRDKERIVESIATNYPILQGMIEEPNDFYNVSGYLSSHINSKNSFTNIYITTTDGKNYNSKFITVEQDTRLRHWYINAYQSKDIVWTQPYEDILTGDMVVTVSMPLKDKDGGIKGVLGADIRSEYLTDVFKSLEIVDDATTYTIDYHGRISKVDGKDILHLGENNGQYDNEISNFLDKMEKDKVGDITFNLDKKYFGVHIAIPSLKWKVVSLVEEEKLFSSLTNLKNFIAITILIALLLIILASIFFSRLFSKSLEKLRKGTLEIKKGNYGYHIKIDRNDEFGELSKTFNAMTSNLSKTYSELKNTTYELANNNNQLQEMNIELEASYEQLQATTEQLNESEARYRTLVENMHDLVWIIDVDFKIIFVNDQIKKILKLNREDVIGKDIRKLNIVQDNLVGSRKDIFKTINCKNEIVSLITKFSETIIVEVNTKGIYENEKLVAIQGVTRDVTKRILMEKEILKRNKELSTINNIGITLNEDMEINTLACDAVNGITKMMDISLCTIRLLEESGKLKLIGCQGELSHLITEEYIDLDEDVIGQPVKTGEIFEISYNDKEYITHFNKSVLESEKADYSTVFPLKARGKILGVMTVSTKKRLNESDWYILSSLSNQLTIKVDNINLYHNLKRSYMKTIKTLAAAVEAKDKYTEGHSLRVSKYAVMIAEYGGLSDEIKEEIEVAGILHDIGKIGVKDEILTKPGQLTEVEYDHITEHPMIGGKILRDVNLSDFIMESIKYHHKRYDLKGYPYNEKVDVLPLGACIIGVADAFDAMTSRRSYKKPMTFDKAIQELVNNSGTQFHPDIVDIMVNIYNSKSQWLEEVAVTDFYDS